jgi:hypothetical protein
MEPDPVEDRPDRRGADLVTEARELGVNPPVPPRRILDSQADDQGAQAGGESRVDPFGPAGWSSAGQRVRAAGAGSSMAWRASRGGGGPVVAARGRRSRHGRSSSSAGVACVVAARPAGDAGLGSRSPRWCRIGCAAPSSPGAWRTTGRSASSPRADHAGAPSATIRQVNGCEQSIGHPQGRSCASARFGDCRTEARQ